MLAIVAIGIAAVLQAQQGGEAGQGVAKFRVATIVPISRASDKILHVGPGKIYFGRIIGK